MSSAFSYLCSSHLHCHNLSFHLSLNFFSFLALAMICSLSLFHFFFILPYLHTLATSASSSNFHSKTASPGKSSADCFCFSSLLNVLIVFYSICMSLCSNLHIVLQSFVCMLISKYTWSPPKQLQFAFFLSLANYLEIDTQII